MAGSASSQVARASEPVLGELLRLEQVDDDVFRGPARGGAAGRVFGGAGAAPALGGAGRTVPEPRAPHSLHAYFLRPGDAARPFELRVDRVRDGGSFTTRQVTAEQGGA